MYCSRASTPCLKNVHILLLNNSAKNQPIFFVAIQNSKKIVSRNCQSRLINGVNFIPKRHFNSRCKSSGTFSSVTAQDFRAAVGTEFLSPYPPHTYTHGDPHTHGRPASFLTA